ncbi:MAG: trypsin-like peptidase domain-containing protein [Candidatus Omnitrophica bacterium]|nr:trypsin-like peptidase domain-containing protein [Candidatus Omnitrophota bacterium]MDE2008930.1 trypsin-like peptidase domain-containing protein [Candidatus Omnitrophota bacterium]MDE2213507.1 trypsin-like peptidase domain-containing protein [Candidatus Omnitrophota bacterium]MDE2230592.1 trypsin-like peptidase domain-containing protein [Candidatus Omnitrophota bacterium]
MRKYLFILCLLVPVLCLEARAQEQTPEQLLQTVRTSLVEVRAVATKTIRENNGDEIRGTYHATGSGVILDTYGNIVTNTHIIANAQRIYVGLSDGTVLEAKRVYSSDADFSFIKVDPPYPLDPISWADSSQAGTGTPIIALTNSDNGQEHILGGEIIKLINGVDSGSVEMFELNLPLVPGDSGGPLLDNEGHLLGLIMGRKTSQDDKSYAIASNKIHQEYMNYQQNLPN